MNQDAPFKTGSQHYEPGIASSEGSVSHRSSAEPGHPHAGGQSSSVAGSFIGGIMNSFKHRRKASQNPDPQLYSAPASAKNPADTQKQSLRKEHEALGPTPVESNKDHYVQPGEAGPLMQMKTQFLREIGRKQAEIQDLQAKGSQMLQQCEASLEHMQADCAEDLQQKDAWIGQLQQDNAKIERNLKVLSNKYVELQSVARTAQEGALQAMEKGGSAPKEDRLVRADLETLQEELRCWAKRYSRAALNSEFESMSVQQKDEAVKELEGYCTQTSWHLLLERLPISSNKGPFVLVQALLAKNIFQNIFADPFFAFPETSDDPMLPNQGGMQLLHRTLTQLNKAGAHMWRSQMIRVLSKSLTNSDEQPLMPGRLHRMASSYAEDFINGPVQIFLREPGSQAGVTKRIDDLRSLYHRAGKLALSLWAQRTVTAIHDPERLQKFNSSSPLMTAHRLHKLDEDDTRLDGRKVVLCVQPAVLAFGDGNGEAYDRSKVWAKAVVLVEGDAYLFNFKTSFHLSQCHNPIG